MLLTLGIIKSTARSMSHFVPITLLVSPISCSTNFHYTFNCACPTTQLIHWPYIKCVLFFLFLSFPIWTDKRTNIKIPPNFTWTEISQDEQTHLHFSFFFPYLLVPHSSIVHCPCIPSLPPIQLFLTPYAS